MYFRYSFSVVAPTLPQSLRDCKIIKTE
jgi:hypothetical protein